MSTLRVDGAVVSNKERLPDAIESFYCNLLCSVPGCEFTLDSDYLHPQL